MRDRKERKKHDCLIEERKKIDYVSKAGVYRGQGESRLYLLWLLSI